MQNTTFSPEVITALATLREVARRNRSVTRVVDAINTLDNAGVFAALDEQTDYADAESILAESARTAAAKARIEDEAEWGDTTAADRAAHQESFDRRMTSELDASDRAAKAPETGEPSLEDYALAARHIERGLPGRRTV